MPPITRRTTPRPAPPPERPGEKTTDTVRVDVADAVLTIRFDRPEEQNALNSEMYSAAADALVLGESDSTVRVVLFTGAPGAFTTGNDISEFRDLAANGAASQSAVRFMKTLATMEKPLVAAIDGLATGIGTTLLFHCDYVVASEWSVFSSSDVAHGLSPDAAATLLAPRLIGYVRAFQLLVMGDPFDAARAREAGLISEVVAPEDVEATAERAAARLAAMPPEAIRLARKLMRGDRRDVVQRIDLEAGSFSDLMRSREARDAFEEFLRSQR